MEELEKIIGIKFKNPLLLKEALTHRSFLNENPAWPTFHNERLEFLGDAVLELSVTELLFHKLPDYDEGRLTSIRAALVNHQMLAQIAAKIGLDKYIYLSRGEAKGTPKAKEVILGNAVEALIGAIYLDQGYETAKHFVARFILVNLERIIREKLYRDPKNFLQELIQEKKKITPSYEVLEESGPDHQRIFTVGVYFDKTLIAKGKGTSKQEAEREAALNALRKLKYE